MTDFDVAIIGGGPAGAAAALTLLRYSRLRPVIVERSSYDAWRVGETLSPGVVPLLAYLGAEDVLTGHEQRQAYATSAAWGSSDVVSRDFLFMGAGDAWHLDRARFDASLAQLIVERGGTLLTNTAWPVDLEARYVIDASGRHAVHARSRGARASIDDHLTGLVSIFKGGEDSGTATLVEAVEDGWWYSARLPSNRTVVAFMTDADVMRIARDGWAERVPDHTRHRIASASLAHGPVICPAHSQILEPVIGDGWIAAGEAAAAFDPLSSMGIGYAIASGIQAARIAAAALAGNDGHARLYAADVRRHYDAYLARRRAYYAIEQRWPGSPFWSRRHLQ